MDRSTGQRPAAAPSPSPSPSPSPRAKALCAMFALLLLSQAFCSITLAAIDAARRLGDDRDGKASEESGDGFARWLADLGLDHHRPLFQEKKLDSLVRLCREDKLPDLGDERAQQQLLEAARRIRQKIVLNYWLHDAGYGALVAWVEKKGVASLQQLAEFSEFGPLRGDPWVAEAEEARASLPVEAGIPELEASLWKELAQRGEAFQARFLAYEQRGFRSALVVAAVIGGLVWLCCEVFLGVRPSDALWGVPLHRSRVRLQWPDSMDAANTKALSVSFFDTRGEPLEQIRAELALFTAEAYLPAYRKSVNAFLSAGDADNVLQIVFNSKLASHYVITLRYAGNMVKNFPVQTCIEPGAVCASETTLAGVRSSTLVLTAGDVETIQLEPKDAFGNRVPRAKLATLTDEFKLKQLKRLGDETASLHDLNFVVYHSEGSESLSASVGFPAEQHGWYKAVVTFDNRPISGEELTFIVLTPEERAIVNGYLSHPGNYIPTLEATIVAENGTFLQKPKTVWLNLTAKQLSIKEYFLIVFPRRLYSFRLIPATHVTLVRYGGPGRSPVIRITDGFQSPDIMLREGNIVAACFYLMLLSKIGGSESFNDKRDFFQRKLIKLHKDEKGHKHSTQISVKVDRHDLINSSYKATKWFTEADWARQFHIEFDREMGIDYGGLRREWFELLCKSLFHPDAGLFVSVEEGGQGVYPNPSPDARVKLKHYKFAGRLVGKCLYESAHGSEHRLHLPTRLARSFLAQLVGLRVHFRHFSNDAPELYTSKIKYIEENTIDESLELTFSDDEYSANSQHIRTVDLIPGGRNMAVTDQNKLTYLDVLAQHRLCNRIKEQTDAFIDGLHQFVPDTLLSLFDESELELLLCGVKHYNLEDLKKHHNRTIDISSQTVQWFWKLLEQFSPEQMARLLQFTTGSSQLPPGGFSELSPLFTIASNFGGPLPLAQTCFNRICLPHHRKFEDYEKAMLTAINEGNEGFGLS